MAEPHQFYTAETYRVNSGIGYLVKQLTTTMGRELDRRMSELGLTDAQWKPLLLLQFGGCSTAADIARSACNDTGAVTRLLDRLEAKGLVHRVRSEEDRRVIHLDLTEDGKRVAADVPRIIAQLSNEILNGFSEAEFHQFRDLLNRALTNAKSLDQGEVP